MIRKIFKWLSTLRFFQHRKKFYKTIETSALPEKLVPNTIYILGDNGYLWYATMICPCGCKSTLQMSLYPDGKPKWDVIRHKGGSISLTPSINRTVGCKSHFFLEKGKIIWCD